VLALLLAGLWQAQKAEACCAVYPARKETGLSVVSPLGLLSGHSATAHTSYMGGPCYRQVLIAQTLCR
jgi:hypothetical protein